MLGVVVLSVFILIQDVRGGYIYPKTSAAFELPNQAAHQNARDQDSSQGYQKTISYSVESEDYSLLKQHNKERIHHKFQDTGNLVNSIIDAYVSGHSVQEEVPILKEQNTINVQPMSNTEYGTQLIKNEQKVLSTTTNRQNIYSQILNLKDIQNINTKLMSESDNSLNAQNKPSELSLNSRYSSDDLQRGLNFLGNIQNAPKLLNVHNSYRAQYDHESAPQTLIGAEMPSVQPVINLQQDQAPLIAIQNTPDTQFSSPQLFHESSQVITSSVLGLNSIPEVQIESFGGLQYSNSNSDIVPTPVITKQISFHVPPPDIEEESVLKVQSLQPKKVYKILFIKLPHQDYNNNAQLQASLYNRQSAPNEEKTVIYVLSKKPETETYTPSVTTLPQQNLFDHEVFFVKYNENSKGSSNEVNDLLHKNPKTERKSKLEYDAAISNEAVTNWK